jgi:RND family efflux transporter MFP subunit
MTALRMFLATTAGKAAAGIAVVVIVTGAIVAPRLVSGEAPAEIRTAPVARASVTQTVDISGAVNPAAQLRLSFATGGRVAEVLVSVGQPVTAGQALARLDVTELDAALRQAEASLASAQARYDSTVAGLTAVDLALAKGSLDDARRRYEDAKRSTASDRTAADLALSKAKTSYATARMSFTTITADAVAAAGTYRSSIPAIRSDVLALRDDLDATDRALLLGAVDALESAAQDLVTADIHAGATLQTAAAEYAANAAAILAAVTAFDRAILDGTDTAAANAMLQSAKTGFDVAASRLTSALDAPGSEVARVETSLSSVHATLTSSDQSLETDTSLDQARADLVRIQIAVEAEQQLASAVRSGVTQANASLATLSDMVSGAYVNALQARESAEARASTTLADQASALRSAQLSYEKTTAAPKDSDVSSAYASLLQAQAQAATAKADLDGATLVAPASGVVASVAGQVGETTAGGGTSGFIVLADVSALVLRGTVGETEVASLRLGQVATVLIDAVGTDAAMTGKVTAIDPVATIQQGVPVYGVDVRIDIAAQAVRAGMTGTATVITANKADVLTVPNLAIRSQSGRRFVQILREGKIQDAAVAFGISNESVTEVTTGLAEGDQVVLPQPRTGAQQAPNRLGGGAAAPAGGVRVR